MIGVAWRLTGIRSYEPLPIPFDWPGSTRIGPLSYVEAGLADAKAGRVADAEGSRLTRTSP